MPDAIEDQVRRFEMEAARLAEIAESFGFVSDIAGDIQERYFVASMDAGEATAEGMDDQSELAVFLAMA
ncbi:MAG: hypothetical protein V3R81_11825, partial [Gammaproteobacteria bacterium]